MSLQLSTSRFGMIDAEEDQVITLPSGLIGFPEQKRYILKEHKEGSSFLWFQSVDDGCLAFVVIDPRLFEPAYKIELGPEDRAALALNNGGAADEVRTFAIVNLSGRPPAEVTANLLGPIVINVNKRLAKQIVLYGSPWSHRHPIPMAEEKTKAL